MKRINRDLRLLSSHVTSRYASIWGKVNDGKGAGTRNKKDVRVGKKRGGG